MPQTVTEHIRFSLLAKRGLAPVKELPPAESEWSDTFIYYMRNRMRMGLLRYGAMRKNLVPPAVRLKSIRKRLDRYQQTGDLETLVDIANLCLCEFVTSQHPNKHWQPADDGTHTEY